MFELACAHVHGNRQALGMGLGAPRHQLGTRGFEHPLAQRQDQARLLCHRNELAWRYQPALGVVPTQQRFHPGDVALVVHHLLVIQHELVAQKALAQVSLQGCACRGSGLHLGVKKAQGIAASRLGLIHGQIRTLEQLVHRVGVLVKQGHTNAG